MSVILRPELNNQMKPVFGSGYRLNPYHPLNRGLISWWLFNEGGGSKVVDVCKIADGSISGATIIRDASQGLAVNLDLNQCVNFGDHPRLDNLSAYSYVVMIRPTAKAGDVFAKSAASNNTKALYIPGGGTGTYYLGFRVYASISGYATYYSEYNAVLLDVWHQHIVTTPGITWNTSDVKWYRDGVARTAAYSTGSPVGPPKDDSGAPYHIGVRSDNLYDYLGNIAYAAVYSRPLSPQEAVEWYIHPYGTPDNPRLLFPGTRVYFVPSEGATGVNGTLSQTLADASITATGAVDIQGSLDKSLDASTVAATGTVLIVGSLSQSLDGAAITAAGVIEVAGVLSKTLDDVSLSAAGSVADGITGTLSVSLADTAIEASGRVEVTGSLGLTLDAVAGESAGTVEVDGGLAGVLDAITISAEGVVGTLIQGVLDSTLNDVSLTAGGLVVVVGQLEQSIEAATLASAGTVQVSGALSKSIDEVQVGGSGLVAIVGVVTATLGDVTIGASGSVQIAGVAGLVLADIAITASGGHGGAIGGFIISRLVSMNPVCVTVSMNPDYTAGLVT